MPRRARSIQGGLIYHVLNRANGGLRLFAHSGDFAAFERVLEDAHARTPTRILSYCLMPTHWHFVLWPHDQADDEVSEFLRWLTLTHTQRWHAAHGTSGSGHLYQGRFKSFPVKSDEHFLRVCRYVERNPLRAGLVERAEDWRWGSLWRRQWDGEKKEPILAEWPLKRPVDWLDIVNTPQTQGELAAIRQSVRRSRPLGDTRWIEETCRRLQLDHTLRSPGRPKLQPDE